MSNQNELLNEIETELFSGDMELDTLDSVKVCEKCGNQPCTCHKSDKVCEKCGKIPCQCDKKQKSNNSTKEDTMPLFDDPELNSLFADEHAPGEGADAGKEAKDTDVTKGEIAGAVACGKKCKSAEEELWSEEEAAPAADDGEGDAAEDTVDGEEAEQTKKKKSGKKCKSDIADLFSDDLFSDAEKDPAPAAKDDDDAEGEDDDDEEDIGSESAELDLEIASEEAAMDFDF